MELLNKKIYLATPYSKYKGGKQEAFRLACLKAMELMEQGADVFSPIAHSHSIEEVCGVVKDGDWWLGQDYAWLESCDLLAVYKIPGWEESYGVKCEIDFADDLGLPIVFLEFEDNNEKQLELFD